MFSKYKKVFLAKDSKVSIFDKVDVVLSPDFYWLKREALPVKYNFQAKKLAPSLFDGYLPAGKYRYLALKDGEKFLLFAYDNKYIIDRLQKLGVDANNVNHVYFAQNELEDGKYYQFADKIYFFQDKLLCGFPASMVDTMEQETEEEIPAKSSKYKISIDKYNLPIEQKTYNILTISLMFFIALLMAQMFKTNKAISQVASEKSALYTSYKLPQTSWQIDSIQKSAKDKMDEQLKIRNAIFEILKSPLRKGEFVKKLDLFKKEFDIEIELNEPKRAEDIKNHLLKTLKVNKIRVVDNTLSAKVAYE